MYVFSLPNFPSKFMVFRFFYFPLCSNQIKIKNILNIKIFVKLISKRLALASRILNNNKNSKLIGKI